jgi:uncharacterized membrane protein YgaE (UPF0421/DUF939 family)
VISKQALERLAAAAWPLLQGTAAATLAWVIARYLFDHDEPFFAPVAALIALNASLGERGLNAVRFIQGVFVGIIVGEITLAVLGVSVGSLALAVFMSMAIARALGGARILIAQAAVGAILTIAIGDADAGVQRLVDALIGAGVALVFSQVLFSPEPVALLRRAVSAALADLSQGLEWTAEALERDDEELAEQAMSGMRDVRDRLAELARTRQAGTRAARRSAVWRSQRTPVVRESENAGHLDLLGVSCMMLTRAALAADSEERRRLAPSVRELSGALAELAEAPGDREARQSAADCALRVGRRATHRDVAAGEAPVAAAAIAVRMVAADLMTFAGVDPERAVDLVEETTEEHEVPTPPPTGRHPLSPKRWRAR